MDTLDEYFVGNHLLALAVEVDVDVSGTVDWAENLIVEYYEEILEDLFPTLYPEINEEYQWKN